MAGGLQDITERRSRLGERLFRALCVVAIALPLLVLIALVGSVLVQGMERLDWSFLTSYPSRKPEQAGILPALVGTLALCGMTGLLALPVGVGAAIWLEEYGGTGRIARIVEVNIANLAGVPSVIYGLLGLEIFVRTVGMGRSVLAGACTLSLLVLPIVVIASREALRTVPNIIRESSMALGTTRWRSIRHTVLPQAMPGILTGSILSVSRAIGETAPLIVVGALTYVTFLPTSLDSPFTALPIQIFNWVSRPQRGFVVNAAAGIVSLLVALLIINGFAIYLRIRSRRKLGG